jgi:hypothetical protein
VKRPDITPAQVVAITASLLSMLAAFGLPLTEEQSQSVLDLITVLAPVLLVSDAIIRNGRSRHKD